MYKYCPNDDNNSTITRIVDHTFSPLKIRLYKLKELMVNQQIDSQTYQTALEQVIEEFIKKFEEQVELMPCLNYYFAQKKRQN